MASSNPSSRSSNPTSTARLDAIWQVLLALGKEGPAEQTLTEAAEIIRSVVGAEELTLWLHDEQENRIVALIHTGHSSVAGCSTEPGGSLVGEVFTSGEEALIQDTAGNPHFPGGCDEVTGVKTRNCYLIPVFRGGRTVGCLQAVNHQGDYSGEEASALRNFGGLAAMAADEKGISFPGRKLRKSILSLRNVTKEFVSDAGVLQILKGVNLDIYENEFLVILGQSGCGKSTLLNLIGGMDVLTGGEILFDGKDFSHPTEEELTDYRRNAIGFVFQSYNLMPNLTALENIEFIAENTPNHGDPEEALAQVGLSGRAGNYPSALSGGQQQRVSIARAIVKRPRLILADEPTGALDSATSLEVLTLFERLVKEQKNTLVMVTHNPEIARMANRVIRVRDGRIGSIQENAWPCSAGELAW